MKVVLTIGYQDILLPDETGVTAIMKTLSKGILVRDRLYDGKIELSRDGIVKLEMKIVPPSTKFMGENDQPVDPRAHGRPVRQHGDTIRLQLEDSR